MRLELSRFVDSDLNDIAGYITITQDNPHRVMTFIQEIRVRFRETSQNPLIYQLRSDIGDEARLVIVGNYVILAKRRLSVRTCTWARGLNTCASHYHSFHAGQSAKSPGRRHRPIQPLTENKESHRGHGG
jgi:plasmid stabilization system protein ParE